jgi:hypothetical protein
MIKTVKAGVRISFFAVAFLAAACASLKAPTGIQSATCEASSFEQKAKAAFKSGGSINAKMPLIADGLSYEFYGPDSFRAAIGADGQDQFIAGGWTWTSLASDEAGPIHVTQFTGEVSNFVENFFKRLHLTCNETFTLTSDKSADVARNARDFGYPPAEGSVSISYGDTQRPFTFPLPVGEACIDYEGKTGPPVSSVPVCEPPDPALAGVVKAL